MAETPNGTVGYSPLQRMNLATELFRQHDKNVTVALIEAFLAIASAPDNTLSQKDLADRLGVKEATVSQIVLRLGNGRSMGIPRNGKALNLVVKEGDPLDGRASRLRLTAQGRNLATAMANVLGSKKG